MLMVITVLCLWIQGGLRVKQAEREKGERECEGRDEKRQSTQTGKRLVEDQAEQSSTYPLTAVVHNIKITPLGMPQH